MPKSPMDFPGIMSGVGKNITYLLPYFTSNSVKVLREEKAYPFGSLVADVGGVLGLFIGFNFLMFWDWFVMGIQNIFLKNN